VLLTCGIMWAASGLTASDSDRAALSIYLDRALSEDDGFEDRFDAEVWLVDMRQQLTPLLPDAQERLTLLTQVNQQATRLDLSPELVLSIIEVESGFDRYAASRAGAQGLMQVMPFWKEEIGRPDDNLIHPDTNLRYGCHILRYDLDREARHLSRALAAYNGSSGSSRYPDKVRAVWHARWRNGPPDW
jgi:soluble lytic murein transglycosylase-like protein